jgi:beta-glucanase (GH16 family)
MKFNRIFYVVLLIALLPAWIMGSRASGVALAANQDVNHLAAIGGPVGQDPTHWSLTFNDEFDGSALNTTKWKLDQLNGSNGELQEYMNDNSHNNYVVQNGYLNITARKEYYQGKNYTSGAINTQGRFAQAYGFYEMRARVPKGVGFWPAFWLLPNPTGWPPETDILEYLGRQPSTAYMILHWSGGQSQTYYNGPDFSADYHTYGLDWEKDKMVWYIDGVERKRFTDTTKIPNMAMYLIANLAVGGTWPYSPTSTTPFPSVYSIDYIRVWKYISSTPSVSLTNNSSFEQTGLSPWYSPWATRNDLGASFVQDSAYSASGTRSFKASLNSANSTQPWVVSLMQKNLPLTAGKTYTFSFYLRANASRSVKAIVQLQNSPYTEYLNKTITVSTSWTKYTYTFTAPVSTSAAMINFNLASQTGSVWVDQVLLCEGTSGCTPKS